MSSKEGRQSIIGRILLGLLGLLMFYFSLIGAVIAYDNFIQKRHYLSSTSKDVFEGKVISTRSGFKNRNLTESANSGTSIKYYTLEYTEADGESFTVELQGRKSVGDNVKFIKWKGEAQEYSHFGIWTGTYVAILACICFGLFGGAIILAAFKR